MRFGKIVGVTAGALVASALSVPAFMGAAHAAPTSATAAVNQDCTVVSNGRTMATAYTQSLAISVDGTAVTVPATSASVLSNAASGETFSTFKMEGITLKVNATVNGEVVALEGTTARAPGAGVSLGDALALPALSGTRTGTDAITQATVTSVAINGMLWVPFPMPAVGSRAEVALTCESAIDTEIKQALECTYPPYTFVYPAVTKVRTSPKVIRVETVTGFKSGMPEFIPVSKIDDNFNVNVAGTDLVAKGVVSYATPVAGDTSFALPPAFAIRTGASNVATSDVKVTGANLVMTVGTSGNSIPCATVGWPTATTLTGTSPGATKVNLSASIDSTNAVGAVEFKEGTNVVATTTVVDGSASAVLTGVSGGSHAYTAVFVPTDVDDFATSTSAVTTVVVPFTQPCIDARAALPGAQSGLASATTAATAATAGVTAASAKVTAATSTSAKATKTASKAAKAEAKAKKAAKKAKGKKAKKAKKAHAKAKKASAKAKKAKSKASSQLKAAKAQLATANAGSATASGNVAAATAALTAVQAAVAKNC